MPRRPLDLNPAAPPPPAKRRRAEKPKLPPQIADPFAINPTEYAPPKERKVKRHTYDTQTIVDVLQFLYFHRILDKIPDGTLGQKFPRYRSGTILQKEPHLLKGPEGTNTRYRSPTYDEAAAWFKIPKSTIGNWWNNRQELIKMPDNGGTAAPGSTQQASGPAQPPASLTPGTQGVVNQAQQQDQGPPAQQVSIPTPQVSTSDGQGSSAAEETNSETTGGSLSAQEQAASPTEALSLLQAVV
jgi:hypothetical protein